MRKESEVDNCRRFFQTLAGIDCMLLSPPEADPDARLVYLHGGAFCDGPVVNHWTMLGLICEKTGVCGLMVDYALAPENPYPKALQEVAAVCRHLRSKRPDAPLYLMGDSSGGGLALSAVLALKDDKEPLPDKLVLLSPWLDLTLSNPEIDSLKPYDYLLRRRGLIEAGRHYANGHDTGHYLLSPVYGDFSSLPPTLLLAGTHEILVCDCRKFREKARAAGVDLTYLEWEGMYHDWMTQAPDLPEANQALDRIAAFLRPRFS
ncbi:MAG: alpha/beta hydrolase [Desulfosalsimonadaceae bacterium]